MRTKLPAHVILGLLLASVLGACGGQGQKLPAPPVAGTPGADSLTAVLQTFAPTQRLEWADLAAACRDRPACTADLATLRAALAARCPTADGCDDPVAMLLYRQRSDAQRAAGLYPAELASASAVSAAWTALAAPDGG